MAENEILHRTELRGVVFWIEKSPEDRYSVHSTSRESEFDQQYAAYSEEDALYEMRQGMEIYERILEGKRKAQPTPRQLAFLFRKKIPIPLTLTWGQASDLIDECLKEKEQKKRIDTDNTASQAV